MNFLLLWLLSSAGYVALVWGLARWLPARSYPLLRGLHWLGTALTLLAGGVPLFTLGEWTFKSVPLFCGLVLAGGVLAGVRARRHLPRFAGLSSVQAVLVGLAAPLLLHWSTDRPALERVYADGELTVISKSYFFPESKVLDYSELELYRTHWLVFEESLGQMVTYPVSLTVPALPSWWRGVSALSFEAGRRRGVARHGGAVVPFSVDPPRWLLYAPPPRPDTVPPPDDDQPYCDVEELPQLHGQPTQDLTTALAQAIRARLRLPPTARPGQVYISLVVDQTGTVRVYLKKGLNAATDSAVLAAARRLPRLTPGRRNGQPVRVAMVVPVLVPGPPAQ